MEPLRCFLVSPRRPGWITKELLLGMSLVPSRARALFLEFLPSARHSTLDTPTGRTTSSRWIRVFRRVSKYSLLRFSSLSVSFAILQRGFPFPGAIFTLLRNSNWSYCLPWYHPSLFSPFSLPSFRRRVNSSKICHFYAILYKVVYHSTTVSVPAVWQEL